MLRLDTLEHRESPATISWGSLFDATFRAMGVYAGGLASAAWAHYGTVGVWQGASAGVLAEAIPGTVWVNNNWRAWHIDVFTPPAPGQQDALTVLTHELGHTAGLGHAGVGVMQSSIPLGVRRLPEVDLPGHYSPWWTGPVSVAASPTQTVVSAGPGGGPNVRTFGPAGNLTGSWYAMDPAWTGGVTSDTHGAVVATGAMAGGGPRVQIRVNGHPTADFFAFDPAFRGGVNVAVGAGWVAVGAGPGGSPHVKVYDAAGTLKRSYLAGPETWAGGVRFNTAGGEFSYNLYG